MASGKNYFAYKTTHIMEYHVTFRVSFNSTEKTG